MNDKAVYPIYEQKNDFFKRNFCTFIKDYCFYTKYNLDCHEDTKCAHTVHITYTNK
jgi:hypothetical protein